MGIESINTALTAGQWEKDAGKKAPPAPVKTAMSTFESAHKGIDWKAAAEAEKAKTPEQAKAARDKIDAAIKQLEKAGAAAKSLAKAAGDLANDKDAGKAAKAAKAAAEGFAKDAAGYFDAALKKLDDLEKAAAKTAKPAAGKGGAPMSKEDEQLLMKFSKKAIQMAMKPKAGAKPMQFAIVGKPGPAIKVLMGSKTEIAKLIARFGKPDPATKKKPLVAKDPASQLIWENGALIFQSGRIPANYIGSVKKALVKQIKKSPKVKWRKPGAADVDDGDDKGDTLSDADLQVAEDAQETARENAAAQSPYKSLLATLSKNPAVQQAPFKAELAEAAKLAQAGSWADALATLQELEIDLDKSAVDEDDGDEGEAAAPTSKAAAAPAANAAAPNDLAGLAKSWTSTRDKALSEIKDLAKEIVKLYPNGDPNLKSAVGMLDSCMKELQKPVDKVLEAAGKATSEADRKKAADAARDAVNKMLDYVKSNEIMKNLDNNEVKPISAAESLRKGLEQIERSLR